MFFEHQIILEKILKDHVTLKTWVMAQIKKTKNIYFKL